MAKKKKKRKKSSAPVVHMSPTKYIKTKSRSLPIHECRITDEWEEAGTAIVMVARQQPSGNLVIGHYLVDTLCLGLKDTHYQYNVTVWEYRDLIERMSHEQDTVSCDYVLAHNVIYGAINFAEELGFSPHKDFASVSEYILEEDNEEVEFMDLEFGWDGEPVLMVGEDMNPARYIKQLNESVGEGNYQVVYGDDTDDWEDEPEVNPERPLRELVLLRAEEARKNYTQQQDTSQLKVESIRINYDAMETEYDRYYRDDLPTLQDLVQKLHPLALNEPETALPQVRAAVARYPRYPTFQNYLFLALSKTKREEEANQLAREMYENFPEYLYAKIGYAELLLTEEKFEEALAVFDGKYTLPAVYPDRTVFHATEMLSFNSFMARYFLLQDDLDRAAIYCSMMHGIDEEHPQTLATESLVGAKLMMVNMESVVEKLKRRKDR